MTPKLSVSEKSGVEPAELEAVFKHIKEKCSNLKILGLMTIGSYEQSTNSEENKDFKVDPSFSTWPSISKGKSRHLVRLFPEFADLSRWVGQQALDWPTGVWDKHGNVTWLWASGKCLAMSIWANFIKSWPLPFGHLGPNGQHQHPSGKLDLRITINRAQQLLFLLSA